MQCPYCNYKESKVVDSRHTDSKSIRRRRVEILSEFYNGGSSFFMFK